MRADTTTPAPAGRAETMAGRGLELATVGELRTTGPNRSASQLTVAHGLEVEKDGSCPIERDEPVAWLQDRKGTPRGRRGPSLV